jgi:hypothetical protein
MRRGGRESKPVPPRIGVEEGGDCCWESEGDGASLISRFVARPAGQQGSQDGPRLKRRRYARLDQNRPIFSFRDRSADWLPSFTVTRLCRVKIHLILRIYESTEHHGEHVYSKGIRTAGLPEQRALALQRRATLLGRGQRGHSEVKNLRC